MLATLVVWLLTTPGAAVAAAPAVSITSPQASATVKGTVSVSATATAASGDYITGIDIYDGVNYVSSISCQQQQSCGGSVQWRATGLSGQHVLTAKAYANAGGTAISAAVDVTVVTPPPSVTITTPSAGSTVEGQISITVSAATDPALDDYPTGIDVYDGANYLHSLSCQGQQTCGGTVAWNATGLSDTHTLTAKVYTNRGVSATSSPVPVDVVSPPPKVRITSPGPGAPLHRRIRVRISGQTDPSQVDYPTSIELFDGTNSIGSVDCQEQETCAGSIVWDATQLSGRHTLRAVIYTNTGRRATSKPVVVGVGIRHSVSGNCGLSRSAVVLHQLVRGRCSLSRVPNGTGAVVEFRSGARWVTVLSGQVRSEMFTFRLRGSRRGRYDLYLRVRATSTTKTTRIHIGVLRIR